MALNKALGRGTQVALVKPSGEIEAHVIGLVGTLAEDAPEGATHVWLIWAGHAVADPYSYPLVGPGAYQVYVLPA